MGRLTPRQREAIPRLVRALAEGTTMRALLKGEDRICAWSTYYRPRRGWYHQPFFREVLAQAQREYDAARLRTAVEDAAERMRRAAPTAVELAEQVVVTVLRGDREGDIPSPLETLLRMTQTGQEKTGQVHAATALLGKGLQAALSILDRADIETAVKSAGGDAAVWRDLLEELRDVGGRRSNGEQMADVGTEAGGVSEVGVPSTRAAVAGAPEPGAGDPGGGGGAEREEPVDGV